MYIYINYILRLRVPQQLISTNQFAFNTATDHAGNWSENVP